MSLICWVQGMLSIKLILGERQVAFQVLPPSEDISTNPSHQKQLSKLYLVQRERYTFLKLERSTLSQEVKTLYERNFERILSKIESKGEDTGFYLYPNDKFHKDLGVCSLKIIPLGVAKINVCTVPKRFILKGGFKPFISGLSTIYIGFDGFKPVYEVHIDSHDPDFMAEFSPEAWLRFFKRVASLMEMDHRIAGDYGIAWFLDPELDTVSPKLTYIREVLIDNGAKLFYIGPSENATRDALTKSPTRRKLY